MYDVVVKQAGLGGDAPKEAKEESPVDENTEEEVKVKEEAAVDEKEEPQEPAE